MTVEEVIERIRAIKPSGYDDDMLTEWVCQLEAHIHEDIVQRCEDAPERPDFSADDRSRIELVAPFPYDEIYLKWLQAKVDYWNGEYDRYQNDMVMYQYAWNQFSAYWMREHMPLKTEIQGARGRIH